MHYNRLVQAVIENNVKLVIELLDNNINEIKSVMTYIKLHYLFYKIKSKEIFTILLNYFDDRNIFDLSVILTSIINVAIMIGMDIEMIQRLFKRGANINLTDVRGISPLLQSIKSRRDLNFIENILKMGANVNQIFDENNTILHLVVSNFNEDDNDLNIIKLLIGYGANVNSKNDSGEVPLMKAISTTNEEIWFELIDRGTNIIECEKNHDFISILACALSIKNRSKELIHKLVISGADLNAINTEGLSPIYVAIKNDYSLECIVNLINYGANVNYVLDPDMITPLLLAIMLKRSKEIVLVLINNNANVNVKFLGKTLLMFAFENEYDIEVINKIINMVTNINEQDDVGVTSLMRAMKTNNTNIISLLINSGANVNLIDEFGKTALFYALIHNNNNDIIKLLIDNGADVNKIKECYNHSWFDVNIIKTNKQHNDFIELIYNKKIYNEKDDRGRTFLMYSIELNVNKTVIMDIINSGSDVNAVDDNGYTPLIYSIKHNSDFDVVIYLIEHGADVNYCDKEGNTLLCHALDCVTQTFDDNSSTKSSDLIKLLINYGCDVNACDKSGKTILMDILGFINDKELINFLIEKGANVNAKTNSGITPLMYAASSVDGPVTDIITLLVDNNAEIDVTDINGQTALFYAITRKTYNISNVFNLLFSRGASINKCISNLNCGYTCLVNHTYTVPDSEILIELLYCNPDISGIDYFGNSFLFCLVRLYKYKELARLLIYDNINTLLKDSEQIICILSNMCDIELFKTFSQFGIDINYMDPEGKTLLMQAVINCRDGKFIKSILDNGGNPKCLDYYLNTPLHFAQSVDVVNVLILYGNNDVRAKNINNKTPLQSVEEPFESLSYFLEIIKHLVLISSEEVNENPEIDYCSNFINDCIREVDQMKCHYIIGNLSFYNLYFKLSNYEKSLISNTIQLNYSNIKQYFPIYFNIIRMLINKYKNYNLKIKLMNYLERLLIIPKISVNSKNVSKNCVNCEINENSRVLIEYVSLDFDSLYCISKYLNLGEIVNLYFSSINSYLCN